MTASILRTTRDSRLRDEWALVLTAAGVESQTAGTNGEFSLSVESGNASTAIALLADYDRERLNRRRASAPVVEHSSNVAWIVAGAILLIHLATGPITTHTIGFVIGSARASAIRSGELWRCLTTLTLHADSMHAISNSISTLIFLGPLARLIGGGPALSLALFSGGVATLVNVLVRSPTYNGIGASTAVFACVGLLAGIQGRGGTGLALWRRYRAIGGAVGIVAMIGANPETDVLAHVLGTLTGILVGLSLDRSYWTDLTDRAESAFGWAAAIALSLAWGLAYVAHAS